EQARGRGEEHVGAVVLFAEQLDGGPGDVEAATQVNVDDAVPIVLGHLVEHHVTQDAGRIDHRMQAAEGVERLLHHALDGAVVGHAVRVGDRFAAGGADLLGDLLGRGRGALVVPLQAAAQVVDDDLGAFLRGDQRAVAPDAVAAACNQDNLAFQCAHNCNSLVRGLPMNLNMANSYSRRSALRKAGNSFAHSAVTNIAPVPPNTAAPTGPSRRATTPLSNSPSSLDAPMNRVETAATRPRMLSGV